MTILLTQCPPVDRLSELCERWIPEEDIAETRALIELMRLVHAQVRAAAHHAREADDELDMILRMVARFPGGIEMSDGNGFHDDPTEVQDPAVAHVLHLARRATQRATQHPDGLQPSTWPPEPDLSEEPTELHEVPPLGEVLEHEEEP